MILQSIIFILGFIFLIYGGNLLVDGSSSLAKHLKISDIVIGLTVVSFGTSAPELTVNILASIQNKSDITIGNIIGSNIANILLILGLSTLFSPITVKHSTIWKEIPFSVLAVIVFFIMANDKLINCESTNVISKSEGLLLICFFIIFLAYILNLSRQKLEENIIPAKYSIILSLLFVVLGLSGLILGGKMVVNSGSKIARDLGVSEGLIGFSLIAVGTSLPELFTSVIAAIKKNSDIAIGNVVGSNIFNIFCILGISTTINPINYNTVYNFDLLVLIITSFLLFTFMFTGRKATLT
jgi:cation:H+ antiporter